jgi:hypothetical protein
MVAADAAIIEKAQLAGRIGAVVRMQPDAASSC